MNFYDVLAAEKWDGGIPTINFFDLLFAQSISGEQWQVYEGTLPATINANGSDLRQYQIYGNTGGVGDRTENILDESTLVKGFYTVLGDKIIIFPGSSGSTVYRSLRQSFVPGTYTISFENNVYIARVIVDGVMSENVAEDISSYTVTTQTGDIGFSMRRAVSSAMPWNNNPTMLTEGSTAPASYVPFGYEVDMVSRTRNLFPSAAEQTITLNGVTATCDGKGKYTFTGTTTNNTAIHFNLIKTSLIPKSVGQGGQGTFSIFNTKMFSGGTENFASLSLTLQGTPIDSWSLNAINKKSDSYTIMGEKNIDGISFYFAGGVATNFSASPMITDNGELPATYEPYSNTTTPIYIGDEPLWAVDNYADYTDYQKQKVVRAIKKYVLTGNENWEEITGAYASRKYFRFVFAPVNYCIRHACISSHFTQTNITTATTTVGFDVFDSSNAGGEVLAIRPTNVQSTTLEDFKAWLAEQYAAGTPVTVWCALTVAEEADPPVPLPALPTCEGTTVIDYAGQSVAPEKVVLEYAKGGN